MLNEALIFDLASICCTVDEISKILKCSKDTIERRYMHILEEGRAQAKQSLRRKQFQVAMDDEHKGQTTMLVWLGKQLLEQTDKRQDMISVGEPKNGLAVLEEFKKVINDPGNERKTRTADKASAKVKNQG